MLKLAKKFWNDEQGLELSEYAVMMALIIAAVIVAIGVLSTAISNRFEKTASTVNNTPAST